MSPALLAAFLWAIAANLAGMLPSRRGHWPAAWVLIAAVLPILVWVFARHGPWIGLACLAAALSILRWPVRRLLAWLGRHVGRAS